MIAWMLCGARDAVEVLRHAKRAEGLYPHRDKIPRLGSAHFGLKIFKRNEIRIPQIASLAIVF